MTHDAMSQAGDDLAQILTAAEQAELAACDAVIRTGPGRVPRGWLGAADHPGSAAVPAHSFDV
jgi:hypothetical protein